MNKPQKYNADQERELLRLQCELARLKLRATQMQAASQQDNLVQMLWGRTTFNALVYFAFCFVVGDAVNELAQQSYVERDMAGVAMATG